MAKQRKTAKKQQKITFTQVVKSIWQFLVQKKTPLVLLVLAQSYILFLWMIGSDIYTFPAITISIAIITAVSLDSVVVSTTFSNSRNKWSWITSLIAMISGVLIVVDLFYHLELYFLHAIFPILVFFFSQHLAEENITVENTNNVEETITRLITLGLDNTQIYTVVGGNRTVIWKLINDIRASMNSAP